MKNRTLLLISAVLIVFRMSAQNSRWCFSPITCVIHSKADSAYLMKQEVKIWEARKSGEVMFYDNPMIDCEFKVKMTLSQSEDIFATDSITSESATRFFGMTLMENRNADSIYLMQFTPLFHYRYSNPYGWRWMDLVSFETENSSDSVYMKVNHITPNGSVMTNALVYSTPLSGFRKVLPQSTLDSLSGIYKNQLAGVLHAQLKGDSLFRFVRYTCDSNEYLPQASYKHLMTELTYRIYCMQLSGYRDVQLRKKFTQTEIQAEYVKWDSTYQVEDPNSPGTFISAPTALEGQPKSFIVYEKWVPIQASTPKTPNYYWPPDGFISYKREVVAYGMNLTNGNTIWFKPEDVMMIFSKYNFDFSPYEESFSAERWRTFKIQDQ